MTDAYVESRKEVSDNGVTEFMACFEPGAPKCGALMFGQRDAFKRVRYFTPTWSTLLAIPRVPYVHSYIALLDCGRPVLMMRPFYASKNGWLFMERVAAMADGELVLDHPFSSTEVDRENDQFGVRETHTFQATDAEIEALRKLVAAKQVVVRLTGSKGYFTIPKDDAMKLREDLATALSVYARLTAAATSHLPATCST